MDPGSYLCSGETRMTVAKMRILVTGWLGAGATEIAEKLAAPKGTEVVNSVRAIKELVVERGESYQIFEKETRSGEYDLDVLLRNKALEYLDFYDDIIVEGRLGLLVLDQKFDIKVFLTGIKEDRIAHVASRRGIDTKKATKVVEYSDREREQVVEKLFDHPLELCRFDLVVNTSSYGMDKSAGLIAKIIADRGAS